MSGNWIRTTSRHIPGVWSERWIGSPPKTVFHLTKEKNLDRILTDGELVAGKGWGLSGKYGYGAGFVSFTTDPVNFVKTASAGFVASTPFHPFSTTWGWIELSTDAIPGLRPAHYTNNPAYFLFWALGGSLLSLARKHVSVPFSWPWHHEREWFTTEKRVKLVSGKYRVGRGLRFRFTKPKTLFSPAIVPVLPPELQEPP